MNGDVGLDGMHYAKNRGNFRISSLVCERRREGGRGREGAREGKRDISGKEGGGGGRIRISLMEREVEK